MPVYRPREGEYIHIPHGTLHAFAPGAVVIAFSVNGDVTYRLYDYDRVDPDTGKTRPTHRRMCTPTSTSPTKLVEPYKALPEETDGCRIFRYHDEPGVYSCGRVQTAGEPGIFRDGGILLRHLCERIGQYKRA